MKNGRAIKGHRRIVVAIGEKIGIKASPKGGWEASCICGWTGGNFSLHLLARQAYRKHIDFVIDEVPHKCKCCLQFKPAHEMRDDYRYMCKPCFSKKGNEWQKLHLEQSDRHKRNHQYLKLYGLTIHEVEDRLASQDSVCAICRQAITDKRGFRPHVDHDHLTGRVRGILCFTCNSGLGAFKDDPVRLLAAIEYLKKWSDPECTR